MTTNTVRFIVSFAIDEGKLGAFEDVALLMTADTRKEPGTLAYEWCLSPDRQRCRLFEAYTDADAVLAHLTGPVVQTLVPRLLETSKVSGFEVYGNPGPAAAELLAGLGAEIFKPWQGFSR
jgi:quinol monooxygenase YgiN